MKTKNQCDAQASRTKLLTEGKNPSEGGASVGHGESLKYLSQFFRYSETVDVT